MKTTLSMPVRLIIAAVFGFYFSSVIVFFGVFFFFSWASARNERDNIEAENVELKRQLGVDHGREWMLN